MSQEAGEQPRKRQRATQACHRCRNKKYKCDSVRPTCSTCSVSNADCVYGTIFKRRGLQSGYVRALEMLWGLVFKKIPGSQNVANELLANPSIAINPILIDDNNNNNENHDDSDCADDLLKCWRDSGILQRSRVCWTVKLLVLACLLKI
jgi:hypothetical protein